MHSVAERTSGSVTALFCCADRFAAPLASLSGSVATATTRAVPKSGARIMVCPSPGLARLTGQVIAGQPTIQRNGVVFSGSMPQACYNCRHRSTEHDDDPPPGTDPWRAFDHAGFRQRARSQCRPGLSGHRAARRRLVPRHRYRRGEEELPRQRKGDARRIGQGMVELHAGRQGRMHQRIEDGRGVRATPSCSPAWKWRATCGP